MVVAQDDVVDVFRLVAGGGQIGAATGAALGIPTGPGEAITIPAGAIIGGMIGETTLAMLYVQLFFYIFDRLSERKKGTGKGTTNAPVSRARMAESVLPISTRARTTEVLLVTSRAMRTRAEPSTDIENARNTDSSSTGSLSALVWRRWPTRALVWRRWPTTVPAEDEGSGDSA